MATAVAQSSYVCGTSSQPLLYRTVGEVLASAAAHWPQREALIVRHQAVRLSYRELDARVGVLARALLASGLRPGDRVGIWSPNNLEWVLSQFATARAGLILVNVNPSYRVTELEYALRKVGCRALIFAPRFRGSDYAAMLRSLLPPEALRGAGVVRSERFPELELLVQLGAPTAEFLAFDELCARAAALDAAGIAELGATLDPDQPVNIQFTSGTTGLPKGATLTHFNIVNNGFFVGEGMRLTPEDRLCIPVPLYHCFGMVLGVLAAVTHGAAMVFPAEAFDAEEVLASVAAERCTGLHGVPTMFISELEHPRFREFDVSSLRTGIMAGAPCPIAVMRRVVSEMHMRELTICYGMTETSPVSFQSHVEDPLEKRVTTVGRIHPHVQVKIVDGNGAVVPRGAPGELLTRGYSVMRGYWDDPERTAEAIDAAGWMHTGDLATLDEEGYCNIVGRVKDMIIRGGENVYPREVEEYLYRHPKVLDVAVVGVPDHKYGEEIGAVIRLREGMMADPQEIIEFCRGQIAHYKVPRYVRFVSDFPMTVTGKVQKYLIREQLRKELGIETEDTA
ncbi:MAG TPA: AMP-binding protein [Steroidobacteraceae bacterium]|nr:AMP-binding protein [Steroidobacteraceae bacterium]